jgi:hypothetical protein
MRRRAFARGVPTAMSRGKAYWRKTAFAHEKGPEHVPALSQNDSGLRQRVTTTRVPTFTRS